MALAVTITAAAVSHGRLRVKWGKRELEFPDLASLRQWVRSTLDGIGEEAGAEIALALLLAKGLKANNLPAVVGRTVTIDLDVAANIVRVT